MIIINALIILTSCKDDDFQLQGISNKTNINKFNTNLSGNNQQTSTYSETFITHQKQNKKVDIMFIVDRSGSMTSEMNSVKDNLFSFFNNLDSEISTKIALMTKIGSGAREIQPPEGIPVTTIDKHVDSHDSLLLVTEYIQENSDNYLALKQQNQQTAIDSDDFFFRPKSIKVFVVVSDDDVGQQYVSPFISEIKNIFDPSLQSIMFFGFFHLTHIKDRINNFNIEDVKINYAKNKNSKCKNLRLDRGNILGLGGNSNKSQLCRRNPLWCDSVGYIGVNYYNMLKDNYFLDEALYDICEKNWEFNFSNITDNVIDTFNSVRSFSLQKTAISIDSVKVDDQNVDQSKYSLENNQLVLIEQFLDIDRQQTIEVTYTIKAPDQ